MSDSAPQTRIRQSTDYAYQLLMLLLCVYALLAVALSALTDLPAEIARMLLYVDWLLSAAFFLDFLRNLYKAEKRWRYFYTWGWIDLLSSIPAIEALRIGRAARVFRILRILRGLRATKVLLSHLLERKASTAVYAIVAIGFSMVIFSAIAVLLVEKSAAGANIKTADDALWWAFTTITTVGYGDRFPVTLEGRAIAVVLMTVGIAAFSTLSGAVAASLLGASRKSDATAPKQTSSSTEQL